MKTSQSAGPTTRKLKVLAVASGGGHWIELLRLRAALAQEDVVYVTVREDYRADIGTARFRVVNDATRWNRLGLGWLALRMTWILLHERPDVVITTGAAPGFLAVLIGKFLGARTCWIDSLANVEELSLCGRKVGPWADMWLTQWPKLAEARGPSYEGSVL